MAKQRYTAQTELLDIKAQHVTLQNASKDASKQGLVNWDDLPHWQQDNHYIHTHYRAASYSFRRSLASIFYLHNEFVNIHSHLWGGVLFAGVPLWLYLRPSAVSEAVEVHVPHPSPWSSSDALAFACFFAGATLCLFTSAIYHCMSNHSPLISATGNKLDYVGIVALITGSFIPSIYYAFYCDPFWYRIYWAMISSLGLACAVMSVTPKFRTPTWRPFRALMFVGMGLSAIFPVLHGLSRWGIESMQNRIGLSWVVLQGTLYIAGAALYAARIPEKWYPGQYDVWGSSHQIFHVLVVLAACSHLVGLLKAADHARSGTCPV